MKKFFHDYSYSTIKLFVTQLAISIFGIALFSATFWTHETLCLILSIFAVAFYLFLIYLPVWEIGAKDRISVDVGKKHYRPHTGLLIGLCANIPNLVLAVLSIFAPETVITIAKLIQGMYWGLISMIKLPFGLGEEYLAVSHFEVTYFVIVIPALVTCWIAYYLGYRNFKISSLFMADKSEKKNEAPKINK